MTGFLTLRISGDDLLLNEITDSLKISPTYSYKKGDTHYDRITNKTIIYIEDCWMVKKEIETDNLEDEILGFLALFAEKTEYTKNLIKKFEVLLWLSVYPESEQYNVHLSHKIIEAIHNLGLSMDIEVADLRAFYDGTYLSKVNSPDLVL